MVLPPSWPPAVLRDKVTGPLMVSGPQPGTPSSPASPIRTKPVLPVTDTGPAMLLAQMLSVPARTGRSSAARSGWTGCPRPSRPGRDRHWPADAGPGDAGDPAADGQRLGMAAGDGGRASAGREGQRLAGCHGRGLGVGDADREPAGAQDRRGAGDDPGGRV